MSHLEMGALVDELLEQLETTWSIEPVRVVCGFLETSLNAPAFSVSVVNASAAARNCSYSLDQIKSFFDVRTTTYWESMTGAQSTRRRRRRDQIVSAPKEEPRPVDDARDLKVDPALLESMLRRACAAVVDSEPDLTRWDTIMGDGDCGETLKTGATALLSALDAGLAKPAPPSRSFSSSRRLSSQRWAAPSAASSASSSSPSAPPSSPTSPSRPPRAP
uniref:DhaK domain-containing protein n=1 Tax=Bionectria ochroleuca TaxID=29856 RepID=A0A8H7N6C7_BIOOC